jgi:mRNA interferase MazF
MQRGEIYFVDLDPVIGREQAGRRPVLVVSDHWINSRPLVVLVVPGTDGANVTQDSPTNVRVAPEESGLPRETVFLCFQARALDESRFSGQVRGQLDGVKMREIDEALRFCFGL